jgi:hypothetical protein
MSRLSFYAASGGSEPPPVTFEHSIECNSSYDLTPDYSIPASGGAVDVGDIAVMCMWIEQGGDEGVAAHTLPTADNADWTVVTDHVPSGSSKPGLFIAVLEVASEHFSTTQTFSHANAASSYSMMAFIRGAAKLPRLEGTIVNYQGSGTDLGEMADMASTDGELVMSFQSNRGNDEMTPPSGHTQFEDRDTEWSNASASYEELTGATGTMEWTRVLTGFSWWSSQALVFEKA